MKYSNKIKWSWLSECKWTNDEYSARISYSITVILQRRDLNNFQQAMIMKCETVAFEMQYCLSG